MNCHNENKQNNKLKKTKILKSFIVKGATDWYSSTLLKFDAAWENWKQNFWDIFSSNGWSSIRYTMLFRYQTGSLLLLLFQEAVKI